MGWALEGHVQDPVSGDEAVAFLRDAKADCELNDDAAPVFLALNLINPHARARARVGGSLLRVCAR